MPSPDTFQRGKYLGDIDSSDYNEDDPYFLTNIPNEQQSRFAEVAAKLGIRITFDSGYDVDGRKLDRTVAVYLDNSDDATENFSNKKDWRRLVFEIFRSLEEQFKSVEDIPGNRTYDRNRLIETLEALDSIVLPDKKDTTQEPGGRKLNLGGLE